MHCCENVYINVVYPQECLEEAIQAGSDLSCTFSPLGGAVITQNKCSSNMHDG